MKKRMTAFLALIVLLLSVAVSAEGAFQHGDVNGDGKINAVDAARIKAVALGKSSATALQQISMDITGDKKINAVDVARVKAVTLNKASLSW